MFVLAKRNRLRKKVAMIQGGIGATAEARTGPPNSARALPGLQRTILMRQNHVFGLSLAGLALTILSADPVRAEGSGDLDGYKIVHVVLQAQAELDAIEGMGVTVLNCCSGVGPLDLLVSPDQRRDLERRGIAYAVRNDNVRAFVERERLPATNAVAAGDPFSDYFLSYHPYGDAATVGSIVWYMNELVARYPGLVSMVNMGTTVEGRTIWGLLVTNQATTNKPGVLYFGAEHAREWITTTIVPFFATHLLENYGTDSAIADLVDNVEFYLVPVFNVDGYIYTWASPSNRFWRKNRKHNGGTSYGVDLNRNWGQGWGGEGSSGSSTSDIYRGPIPFSEVETQAFRDFLLSHPNVRAQADIHSYSQLILWPFGHQQPLPPDQPPYATVGFGMQNDILNVHGRFYDAGPTYTTIYPASGVSVDWTYMHRDVLSFAFECRDTGAFGFDLPADQIIPNGEEMVPALLRLANSEWVRSAPKPTVTVEGSRYLSVDPAGVASNVAIRVTSPDFPCMDKFATSSGVLEDTPELLTPVAWGTRRIGDAALIPLMRYDVSVVYEDGHTSDPVQVTMERYADVRAPYGFVNFQDVAAIVARFQGVATAPTVQRCDLSPGTPDGIVNFVDVTRSVDAFMGRPYPFSLPCP